MLFCFDHIDVESRFVVSDYDDGFRRQFAQVSRGQGVVLGDLPLHAVSGVLRRCIATAESLHHVSV